MVRGEIPRQVNGSIHSLLKQTQASLTENNHEKSRKTKIG